MSIYNKFFKLGLKLQNVQQTFHQKLQSVKSYSNFCRDRKSLQKLWISNYEILAQVSFSI